MGGCGQSSHWRILKISFPPLRLYGVCGAKICLKTTDPGLVSILTAQNYCNSSKLPSFLIVNLYCFHTKSQFYPPPFLICINPLVLFVRQTWNGNNAILVMKASSLLPSSPRVFCPLLSSSVLFPFFGKPSGFLRGSAPYYCCRTGYKLLQERFPAILSRHGKTRASSVSRMAYRKRCYTLYLLFLLFSLLSRLHRNNTNTPDTLFFG